VKESSAGSSLTWLREGIRLAGVRVVVSVPIKLADGSDVNVRLSEVVGGEKYKRFKTDKALPE
jgi:hypothetical protein